MPNSIYAVGVILSGFVSVQPAMFVVPQRYLRAYSKSWVLMTERPEDLRYTLETVACLGCCGLSPVVMVNDDTHGRLVPDKLKGILEQYE